MNVPMKRAALAAALLSISLGCASAAGWQGTETVVDGVLRVENPAEGIHSPATIELEELWRLGGDSEEDGEFFGVLIDATVGPNGDVYLLDQQLAEVSVFDAGGEYLRTIGHEGEGPGEFRRPVGIFFFPEGDLGVVQSRPARIVRLDTDGVPGPIFPVPGPEEGGFRRIQSARFRGGMLGIVGVSMKRSDVGGERSTRLLARPRSLD